MASAIRSAILRRLRVQVVATRPAEMAWMKRSSPQILTVRSMSSHDDHIDKAEVVERVLSVVKSFPKVDPSKVTSEVHFQNDLGLDSLDNVEIVMALEEEFKLEIPDQEADKIDSCAVAIEYITAHPMAGGEVSSWCYTVNWEFRCMDDSPKYLKFTILMASNPVTWPRCKHAVIDHQFTRELVPAISSLFEVCSL